MLENNVIYFSFHINLHNTHLYICYLLCLEFYFPQTTLSHGIMSIYSVTQLLLIFLTSSTHVLTSLVHLASSQHLQSLACVSLLKPLFYFFFLILKSLILTRIPKHEPPSHLPPHNISLGHPHAPAPSMLYPVSDIDWRFDSYMIVYKLECHSPKSSHPRPLPLSPKVGYTYLCLFCCLAYRVVIAIFLNSIYMC